MNDIFYIRIMLTIMTLFILVLSTYHLIISYKTDEFIRYIIVEIVSFVLFLGYYTITLYLSFMSTTFGTVGGTSSNVAVGVVVGAVSTSANKSSYLSKFISLFTSIFMRSV